MIGPTREGKAPQQPHPRIKGDSLDPQCAAENSRGLCLYTARRFSPLVY